MAAPQPSDLIVTEARSWLGTPYHHAAGIKGRGVDCAMLLVRVFVDVGLVAPFDPRPYPPDWYLHRDEERFLGWISKFGERVPDGEPCLAGDVRLYNFGRCVSHGAIVEDETMMIHAWLPAQRVERVELNWCLERFAATYRVRP